MTDTASRMTAESFLTRLAERGIDYVMANAGTDFAPIIEALSRNPGTNRKYPRVITVPHENVAVAMAHGYYRVSRQAGGGDGARDGRHRERDLRPDERRARQRADPARRRPHPAHRDRPPGLAQPLDPLGPGDVRPGRPRPRVREVGLRAARRAGGRVGGRPRDRHRDERAARPGLPDAAARGSRRARGGAAPREPAPDGRERAGAVAGGDRGGRGADRQGRVPADPHSVGGAHAGGDGGAHRARRRVRASRRAVGSARHQPADRSRHVPRLRSRSLCRQGRRARGVRQRGAVDSARARVAPRRQGDLVRPRSAVHPLSVPRIRGRPPGDRRILRHLHHAARGAPLRAEERRRRRLRRAARRSPRCARRCSPSAASCSSRS